MCIVLVSRSKRNLSVYQIHVGTTSLVNKAKWWEVVENYYFINKILILTQEY